MYSTRVPEFPLADRPSRQPAAQPPSGPHGAVLPEIKGQPHLKGDDDATAPTAVRERRNGECDA
jgi:hypothetical protein